MVLPPATGMDTGATTPSLPPQSTSSNLPFSLINLLKYSQRNVESNPRSVFNPTSKAVGLQSIFPMLSRSTLDNIFPSTSSFSTPSLLSSAFTTGGLSLANLDPFSQLAALQILQADTSSKLRSPVAVPLPVRVTPYPVNRPPRSSSSPLHFSSSSSPSHGGILSVDSLIANIPTSRGGDARGSPPSFLQGALHQGALDLSRVSPPSSLSASCLPSNMVVDSIMSPPSNNLLRGSAAPPTPSFSPKMIRRSSQTRNSSSDESSISSTSLPYHKYSPFHAIYKSQEEKKNAQRQSAFQKVSQDLGVDSFRAKLTDQVMRQVFLNTDSLSRVTATSKESTAAHSRTNNVCKYCEKMFPSPSHLLIHLRTHSGERPYPCPGCGKTFATRGHLRRHYRIHTGVKPYKCQVCDKAFANQGNLKTHTRLHTGEKPYKCPRCDKAFADAGNLQRHITTHTGVKPYKCVHCSKAFSRSSNLKTHLLTHTGLKPFSCSCCNKSFTRLSYLKAHMKGIRHADKITSPHCNNVTSQSSVTSPQNTLIAALTDNNASADFRSLSNLSVQVV